MHPELKKTISFAVVGILNTAIGLSSIYLFRMVTGDEVLANISGYSLGVVISYCLNGKFTFSSKIKSLKNFLKFLFAFLLAWSANIIIVLFFISQKYSPELSHILGIPAYTIVFYLLSRFYVFTNPETYNRCSQI
jgi:putative flippase GtrA